MSIASELTNLATHIGDAYDAVNNKGGTIPANKNMANLAAAIASIVTGGGGGNASLATGQYTPSATTSIEFVLTHNLGVQPKFFAFWDASDTMSVVSGTQLLLAFGMDSSIELSQHKQYRLTPYASAVDATRLVFSGVEYGIDSPASSAYSRRTNLSGATPTTIQVLCTRYNLIGGRTYAWLAVG